MDVSMKEVTIPKEFRDLQELLENYVESRLIQFAVPFAHQFDAQANEQDIERIALSTKASIPPPRLEESEPRDASSLALVFRHDCRSLGCEDSTCELCMHNPCRKCVSNFGHKYLVEDSLIPKCEAPVWVELVDRKTGKSVRGQGDLLVEVSVLNGVTYEESGANVNADKLQLEEMEVLQNKELTPLLVARSGGVASSEGGKVSFTLKDGVAQLPELYITASSEALLSGRKPPFRLWVRPVEAAEDIKAAISEPFVVATKRVRTAGKVETPCVNDDVSKLKHMGKETVKKLKNLKESAAHAGIHISEEFTMTRVTKVREFQALARFCENDPQLTMQLQSLLKLNKSRWREACDHASQAVKPDSRMRIWYENKDSMNVGLLFSCRLGNIDLERPIGLLQKSTDPAGNVTMTATLTAHQTPGQREQVLELKPSAIKSWWLPGHPGWAIHPADSEAFLATGSLEPTAPADAPLEFSKDSVVQESTSLVSPTVTVEDNTTPTMVKSESSEPFYVARSTCSMQPSTSSPAIPRSHSNPPTSCGPQYARDPYHHTLRCSASHSPTSQSFPGHMNPNPNPFQQLPTSSAFAFEASLSNNPIPHHQQSHIPRSNHHRSNSTYLRAPSGIYPGSPSVMGAPGGFQMRHSHASLAPEDRYFERQLVQQQQQRHQRHRQMQMMTLREGQQLPLTSRALLQEDLDAIVPPPELLPMLRGELMHSGRDMRSCGLAGHLRVPQRVQSHGDSEVRVPQHVPSHGDSEVRAKRAQQQMLQQTNSFRPTNASSRLGRREVTHQGSYTPSASPTVGLQITGAHGAFSSPTSGQSEQTGGLRVTSANNTDFITTAASFPDDILDKLLSDQCDTNGMEELATSMPPIMSADLDILWQLHDTEEGGHVSEPPTNRGSPTGSAPFPSAVQPPLKRQRC